VPCSPGLVPPPHHQPAPVKAAGRGESLSEIALSTPTMVDVERYMNSYQISRAVRVSSIHDSLRPSALAPTTSIVSCSPNGSFGKTKERGGLELVDRNNHHGVTNP
jgi:hypothetical protein